MGSLSLAFTQKTPVCQEWVGSVAAKRVYSKLPNNFLMKKRNLFLQRQWEAMKSTERRSRTPLSVKSIGSNEPTKRSSSFRLPSPAPSIDAYDTKSNWKNSLRSSESPARSQTRSIASGAKSKRSTNSSPRELTEKRSQSSDGKSFRSSESSTDWGYTSYESFTARKSHEEERHQRSSFETQNVSYKKQKDLGKAEAVQYGEISLRSLKTPEITSWYELGVLGLSSKIYSDTSELKEKVFTNNMKREPMSTQTV